MGDVGKAVKKGWDDTRAEGGREVGRWQADPLRQMSTYGAIGAGAMFPVAGLAAGYAGGRLPSLMDPGQQARIIRQGDPNEAKKFRKDRRAARRDANGAALLSRQRSMASGTGGGGMQVSGEIDAYNSVLAAYAAQRAQTEQAQASGRNQSLAQLMQLIALL